MNTIAKFEKVSFEQFQESLRNTNLKVKWYANKEKYSDEEIYENIKLPKRATKGSAGYDFYIPYSTTIISHVETTIPTGIRVKIDKDWVLKLYARSSLGFKYRFTLNNGTGIIDNDYYYSNNEGHIFAKMTNNSESSFDLNIGDAFMQGIFSQFGLAEEDNILTERNGGFGSTND